MEIWQKNASPFLVLLTLSVQQDYRQSRPGSQEPSQDYTERGTAATDELSKKPSSRELSRLVGLNPVLWTLQSLECSKIKIEFRGYREPCHSN
jgi:hypothetical protein